MDLGPLRDLVTELNFDAHGVAATVTPPAGAPITTTGIWIDPETEGVPGGEFSRTNPKRIMALKQADVPSVPRGTTIVAPEKQGGADKTWRVDGVPTIKADHCRVSVVLEP